MKKRKASRQQKNRWAGCALTPPRDGVALRAHPQVSSPLRRDTPQREDFVAELVHGTISQQRYGNVHEPAQLDHKDDDAEEEEEVLRVGTSAPEGLCRDTAYAREPARAYQEPIPSEGVPKSGHISSRGALQRYSVCA